MLFAARRILESAFLNLPRRYPAEQYRGVRASSCSPSNLISNFRPEDGLHDKIIPSSRRCTLGTTLLRSLSPVPVLLPWKPVITGAVKGCRTKRRAGEIRAISRRIFTEEHSRRRSWRSFPGERSRMGVCHQRARGQIEPMGRWEGVDPRCQRTASGRHGKEGDSRATRAIPSVPLDSAGAFVSVIAVARSDDRVVGRAPEGS